MVFLDLSKDMNDFPHMTTITLTLGSGFGVVRVMLRLSALGPGFLQYILESGKICDKK